VIKIQNLTSGLLVISLSGHTLEVHSLIDLKSDYLASASYDCTIKVWNFITGICLKTLKSHALSIYSLALVNNYTLLSGSLDGTVKIWDLENILRNTTIQLEFSKSQ
jgi:WD40 repeat protein